MLSLALICSSIAFVELLGVAPLLGARQNGQERLQPNIPTVDVVRVVSKNFFSLEKLPAELAPWQAVAIYPKVRGFVEHIYVDRGSIVQKGQVLVQLSAPELLAQTAQAQATLIGDEATYRRLLQASHTPGAVSANELELAEQTYKADKERVRALEALVGYLTIRAPFSGVITERNVHPGALVGPPSEPIASAIPMLRLQQIDHLRLVVPVPQADAEVIPLGDTVSFTVSTFPGRRFTARISRISHALDPTTRTMAVEADVYQKEFLLAPGMFVEVSWPVRSAKPSLFVPLSSIGGGTTPYVNRVVDQRVVRVPVSRGRTMGELVEVYGNLMPGDLVVADASAELEEGERVRVHLVER